MSYANVTCPKLSSESTTEAALKQLFLERAILLDYKLRMGEAPFWRLSKSTIKTQRIHAERALHLPVNSLSKLQFMCNRSGIFAAFSAELYSEVFASLTHISPGESFIVELMGDGRLVWSEQSNLRKDFRQSVGDRKRLHAAIAEMIKHLA